MASDAYYFGLKKVHVDTETVKQLKATSDYAESVVSDSPYNFLYTVNISIGTPKQNSTYVVDINYPLTTTFTYGSVCYSNSPNNTY